MKSFSTKLLLRQFWSREKSKYSGRALEITQCSRTAVEPGLSVTAILVALMALTRNDLEAYPVPLLAGICVALELLFLDVFRQHRRWDFQLLIVSGLAFIFLLVLRALPEFVTGLQLNAVIHRSVFSTIFLLAAACQPWSLLSIICSMRRPRQRIFPGIRSSSFQQF